MVEFLVWNQDVAGSNPAALTNYAPLAQLAVGMRLKTSEFPVRIRGGVPVITPLAEWLRQAV